MPRVQTECRNHSGHRAKNTLRRAPPSRWGVLFPLPSDAMNAASRLKPRYNLHNRTSLLAPAGGSRKPLRERSGRDLILPRRRVQKLGRLRGARQGIVLKSERAPKCWGRSVNAGGQFRGGKASIGYRRQVGRMAGNGPPEKRTAGLAWIGARFVANL
jgi:hypothetical protein